MSRLIYDYTSGYPYMVSRICKLIDERIALSDTFPTQKSAWTPEGFQSAIRLFLKEPNTLFDDMVKKLNDYPELKSRIKDILFRGAKYTFEIDSTIINIGFMFGFLKDYSNNVVVANRIFETKLYNLFLSEEELAQGSQPESANLKNQFVSHGMLQIQF